MHFLSGLIIAGILGLSCFGGPVVYIATDHTGAQTQVDINHSSQWLLNPDSQYALGGGVFSMKDGESTTASITFSLFEGTDATGSLLATITLTHDDFCAPVNNCGQYALHLFAFATPVPLIEGTSYFANLTSGAPDVQSLSYFIKDGFYLADVNGTPVVPQPGVDVSSVPEPATFVLVGAFLIVLGSSALRLRQTSTSPCAADRK